MTPPPHTIVVDLGLGDAGKGTVVDHLCARARAEGRPVDAVVRFNGGAQAAHNVVADDGRHHTFAQFGAGTFTPGVRTHLSRYVMVDPLALAAEAAHLAALGVPAPLGLVTVHRDALLTTPYHALANRARERARGAGRHGSCGMGVGETAAYALARPGRAPTVGDCRNPARLTRLLTELRDHVAATVPGAGAGPPVADCADAFRAFADAVEIVGDEWTTRLLRRGRVVFEGAQGVLLDEWHGWHPCTTWSTTTFANAEALLAGAGVAGAARRMGVLRTYTTRHGPGPLVSEDRWLTAAAAEPHNRTGPWQGPFRAGAFDAVAHRYAVEVAGGVDEVALTHLDTAARLRPRVCDAYEAGGRVFTRIVPGPPGDLGRQAALTRWLERARPRTGAAPGPREWPDVVAAVTRAPVTLLSWGPRTGDKERYARARAATPPYAGRTPPRPAPATVTQAPGHRPHQPGGGGFRAWSQAPRGGSGQESCRERISSNP